MEPRLNVITLAVEDLERALTFYRDGLGFQSPGVIGSEWTDERTGANGAVALFELEGGLLLSLYPRSDLAKDAEIPVRGCAERRVQPRPARPEPHRCRRAPRESRSRRREHHTATRTTVGDLFRLLP